MTKQERDTILGFLHAPNERFKALKRIEAYLATITPEKAVEGQNKPPATRTQSQHNSLFLWFSMIEHEAQNAGITWNQLVGKTHQLKITKEGLHVMAKQLSEALWGIKSTKDLKKTGHIDDLVDHFVDLFSKVGLELPPFPSEESKKEQAMYAKPDVKLPEYPDDPCPTGPTF